MHQRLSEQMIRQTLRELITTHGLPSGRGLCAELRRRHGSVGRTERVFAIWREVTAAASKTPERRDLEARLQVAEARAAALLERAERAELREQAHQDHWAMEVDRLRQEVSALRGAARSKPFPV